MENRRPLILIVDDDRAVRELLKLHLVGEGYEVRLADDAIIAGRSLMEAPPDLMLVDIALPYIDGVDFVGTLKAETAAPDIPIIFITGNPEVISRARLFDAPCLRKPFTAAQLVDAVRTELARHVPRMRARLEHQANP